MFKVGDLYPGVGMTRTGEKTLLDADEVSTLHGAEIGEQPRSIWVVLAVIVGVVVLIGVVQR